MALLATIVILFSFLYIKYEDIVLEPRVREAIQREKVGIALRNTNVSKRRYSGSLTYFNLPKGGNINNGDTLFTQQQASVDIQLQGGSIIRVNQLSLLIVGKRGRFSKIFLGDGELTGTFAENDRLLFDVDEQEIEVFGQQGDQFWISKKGNEIPFVAGIKGHPKVKLNGVTYSIENSKLNMGSKPEKKDLDNSKSKSNTASTDKSPTTIPSKKDLVAKQIDSNKLDSSDLPFDIPTPYPPNDQLFFLRSRGEILLLPKSKCLSSCKLSLIKDKLSLSKWEFDSNQSPAIKLFLLPSGQGRYQWELQDGKDATLGEFEVRVFTQESVAQALNQGRNFELLD